MFGFQSSINCRYFFLLKIYNFHFTSGWDQAMLQTNSLWQWIREIRFLQDMKQKKENVWKIDMTGRYLIVKLARVISCDIVKWNLHQKW